jgi:O-acetyl-ADP-ribose deacetylase (regulator of RNase III)
MGMRKVDSVEATVCGVKLYITKGDIIQQDSDAIVNAANSSLMGGGGVDGAIHRAGGSAILEECKQIVSKRGCLPTGKAVITTGGRLKARHVIHTVGPIWHGGNKDEAELLAGAYRESLKLAAEKNLSSISFPSISTGAYGYPVDEATKVALGSVISFLRQRTTSIREVIFVLFDSRTFEVYSSVLAEMMRLSNEL